MKITHDKKADAIYVSLKKGPVSRTVEVSNNVLVDVNKEGEALGIEILNVSVQAEGKKPIYIKSKIPTLA